MLEKLILCLGKNWSQDMVAPVEVIEKEEMVELTGGLVSMGGTDPSITFCFSRVLDSVCSGRGN